MICASRCRSNSMFFLCFSIASRSCSSRSIAFIASWQDTMKAIAKFREFFLSCYRLSQGCLRCLYPIARFLLRSRLCRFPFLALTRLDIDSRSRSKACRSRLGMISSVLVIFSLSTFILLFNSVMSLS